MNYSNNKVSDIQIAYIGGGSRGWAWTFMTDLALDDQISGTIRLYDIDRQAADTSTKPKKLPQKPEKPYLMPLQASLM